MIGVPNEEFGEEVKAIVSLVDGVVADDELADTLRCVLPRAARRVQGAALDRLPRRTPTTGTGKVQKAKLRAPYWEGQRRQI